MELDGNILRFLLAFLVIWFIVVVIQIQLIRAIFTIKNQAIKQTKLLEAQMRLIALKMDTDKVPMELINEIIEDIGYTYDEKKQKKDVEYTPDEEPWR